MSDLALERLCEALPEYPGRRLLVADEQLDSTQLLALKSVGDLDLLTNRYDVHLGAQAKGINSVFSDMDLDQASGASVTQRYDVIGYRISKEKAVVHHVINQIPNHLTDDGVFLLCGHKQEGMKTYLAKAEAYFGTRAECSKGPRQFKLAELAVRQLGEPLPDQAYLEPIKLETPSGLSLYSKPGQYGWRKVDQGSQLLLEMLEQTTRLTHDTPGSVLDLGCGYGYLSIAAWALGCSEVTATDNNAAALGSCRQNFADHGVNGYVIADDCAASIHHQFDMVLCNPPFHKGFDTEQALTDQFLRSASCHLKPSGSALFVVNQFIPIEQAAAPYFHSIEKLCQQDGFKVIQFSS